MSGKMWAAEKQLSVVKQHVEQHSQALLHISF